MTNDASSLPDPLTPLEIDLKGFPGFVLDVEALLASEMVALSTGEELAAALMLWCRAWQQNPHGSLPNDERVLAAFSRAKNWKKVRNMAMRGFTLCSDGRLYHKTLCIKVHEAWAQRVAYQEKRKKDAERLEHWRDKKRAGNKEGNGDGNATGNDDETRFNAGTKHVRSEVKGSEETTSVPDGTGAAAPSSGIDPADAIFQIAVPWLVERGMKEANARSLLGGARKQLGDDEAWALAQDCMSEKPLQPAAWLAAALNARIGRKRTDSKFHVAGADHTSTEVAAKASAAQHGVVTPEDGDIPFE